MSEGGGPAAATQGLVHQHQVQQHDDRSNILQKMNNYLLLTLLNLMKTALLVGIKGAKRSTQLIGYVWS